MAEVQPTKSAHHHRSLRGLLLPILLVAGFAYLFFRPIPPSAYPDFAKFPGTLTVSHSQAILGAQLNEHSTRYLLDVLDGCRFKATQTTPESAGETITLSFGETGEFVLYPTEDCTLITVKKGEAAGTYRLKSQVYEQVLTVINAAFPDGVQALEFLPWWQQYLSIASQTLLKTDFKSPKEIPYEDVVLYTYLQMVADGSAGEYRTLAADGTGTDTIPYDLFLRRARQYFAEGASPSIKQSRYYWADTNSFAFPSRPEEFYGNYPYGQPEELRTGLPYRLSALTRDSSGYITAVFEDYSALGFQDQGTLTRLHYLTLVPGSEGEYRFASKRSELVNQSTVSAEGYFLSLATIADMTPDQAYASDLESLSLGEELLLYSMRYTSEAARLTLYRISPATGNLLGKQVIESGPSTIFLSLKAGKGELLVKTNQAVIRLEATGDMEKTGEIRLPLEKIPTFDATDYDITEDCSRLVYSDGEGVKFYQLKTGLSSLIVAHPTKEEASASSQSPSSQPEGSKYTRPVDFVMPPLLPITPPAEARRVVTEYYRRPVLVDGETKLLVAATDEKEVLSYAIIDLTADKRTPEKLDVKPITGGVEYTDRDKILIAKYPEATGEEENPELLTEYSLRYFDGQKARRFTLDYDPTAPSQLVSGDYLYYFSHETGPAGSSASDHFYRLVQVDLKTLEQKPLSVLIQNALPQVLAVGAEEQVLFSYRAPAGMGFGITRKPAESK